MSTSAAGGGFEAYDRLRPAEIVTLDMRRDASRLDALLDPRGDTWVPSDIARDADNVCGATRRWLTRTRTSA